MAVGLSDGTSFADHGDWLATSVDKTEKRRNDSIEMAENEKSGDFQSRFPTSMPSGMPLEATEKLTGAFKSIGSTGVPENGGNIKSDRSVLQKLTGSDGGERYQTWPERLVRDAFTLPGDVLSGTVEPGSIQEIERAAELASVMVGGPAPVAAKMANGSLGSFAGVKSRTLPRDKLYEAQNMELDMTHPDMIWEKTGFFRGADNRWRYEIPDKDAKLNPAAFDEIKYESHPNFGGEAVTTLVPKKIPTEPGSIDFFLRGKNKLLTLDKVIDHPELFKAYPELKTMKVGPLPEYLKNTGIQGQVSGDTIHLAEGHPDFVRSVLLHEIQHQIQHHEGFAYGGNQQQFLPKELPQAEKEFLQIKKDIEPKLVEELGSKSNLEQWKIMLRHSQEGLLHDPVLSDRVAKLKEEHPAIFKRLDNIVKSERLIQKAKDEAFEKYQRLMGEVEARNVQARANYAVIDRSSLPPYRTEDRPRIGQINSQ